MPDITLSGDAVENHLESKHLFGRRENGGLEEKGLFFFKY